jgi:hypothetical protein
LAVDLEGTGALSFFDVIFQYVDGQVSSITDPVECNQGVPCDVFAFDPSGEAHAQATARAIAALLNDANAARVGTGSAGIGAVTFAVAYDFYASPSVCSDICTYKGWNPSGTWASFFSEVDNRAQIEFARLTPVMHAPIPPAVFLFASGLALLGMLRRKRPGAE